jgi:hypothetical protein
MTGASDLMLDDERTPAPHLDANDLMLVARATELLLRVIRTAPPHHQRQHLGIAVHTMLLHLSTSDRVVAIAGLQRILREGAN